jgi:hypothetical protein
MANIINGTDTGSGGLITTGDSSDELQIQTAETTAITVDSGQRTKFSAPLQQLVWVVLLHQHLGLVYLFLLHNPHPQTQTRWMIMKKGLGHRLNLSASDDADGL